jgi:hypothetical protein
MKFDNYYLDLEKVNALSSKEEKEQIHRYYMEMIHSSEGGLKLSANSFFNTLYYGGYLKEVRVEKLDKILS